MWLRSEVTEQRRRRLTARVLAQPSKVSAKQGHVKASDDNIRRTKTKTVTCRKHKPHLKTEQSEEHTESSQQLKKPHNTKKSESDLPHSRSTRLLERISIRGVKLKQNIVRSRKLDSNNQRPRILHRVTRWHRRNANLLKDSYYENGIIFNKKNLKNCYERLPNRSKKRNGANEEIFQQHKKISLLKNIKKHRVFSDETSKMPVVSNMQRKSSFKMSSEQKCNINCCDKKCIIEKCTEETDRLDLISGKCINKSNIVVLSQYIHPSLRVGSIQEKNNASANLAPSMEQVSTEAMPPVETGRNELLPLKEVKTEESVWCPGKSSETEKLGEL